MPSAPGRLRRGSSNQEKQGAGDFMKQLARGAPQHAKKISRRAKNRDGLRGHLRILV